MQVRPGVARYVALADDLRARITSGDLAPGTRIPSEASLAQEVGVSRETMRRAVQLLRAEGLIEVRLGLGMWVRVPDEPWEEFSLQRGSRVRLRMPTAAERASLGLDAGVPVAVVRHGSRTHVLPGDRYFLIAK